ncbi:MAG: bifunctional glutamate N-acetyltransferase/amino-acid acetyltransferase ArgJ [Selenomonadaceae bacterium]|uniref:bifunctional glutamate N-acetyltransferase/amino-acid acetyltransferase ArgJ n=1 Tax=Anaerovibrio slackiae TaxID=2652309 RepID=UPI003865013E|nr:bifunctional glutamate N-acetyltransferase/amino-acid acetyltransferase ArgJ [Selenomonadaceae bacterium]MBQ5919506.1 bifunctional glutamate N-acetyltransferase/amino-acid acetyltransferase ArgJ [Selenomonadaceae bacterium]MBR0358986.1 bifunctional glutamate N-acetyltransferase/amino-acid acetyltransferase ArgJ [Selenomonadaceae bacterium]MCI6098181.1 bifunctional glutamate N-acetyltransferase/amino-acid acetyltransferase ArgJ [Selenomonadaceae bacterium]
MFSEKNAAAGVTFPKGFKAAGVKAGIKKSGNLDLALIYTEKEAAVAGVFTKNAVAAAPVIVSREVVKGGKAHAIVANAGCANACTGETGLANARKMAALAAAEVGCAPDEVLVGSTGIIGVNLPMDKLEAGIKAAAAELSEDGSKNAGNAIITTDTYSKACSCEVEIGGQAVRFGAIAKGSGMIQPNMATMLCYITTDANISSQLMQKALSEIVEVSFNMISVDGDMSTNDTVLVLANGASGAAEITDGSPEYDKFYATLKEICQELSKRIAADGEGATKFLTINVSGTKTFEDAKTVAMSIAKSPLVKTAFFGEDPNWGRVICAVGYAGIPMVPEKTVIKFGGVPVYANGLGAEFNEDDIHKVMAEHDIVIDVEMGMGDAKATVWSCDFSYEYVKINGEYHT